jgi:hypothetical protein
MTKTMTDKLNEMKEALKKSLTGDNKFFLQFNLKGTNGNVFCCKGNGAELRVYGHEKTFRELARTGLITFVSGDMMIGISSYYTVN